MKDKTSVCVCVCVWKQIATLTKEMHIFPKFHNDTGIQRTHCSKRKSIKKYAFKSISQWSWFLQRGSYKEVAVNQMNQNAPQKHLRSLGFILNTVGSMSIYMHKSQLHWCLLYLLHGRQENEHITITNCTVRTTENQCLRRRFSRELTSYTL